MHSNLMELIGKHFETEQPIRVLVDKGRIANIAAIDTQESLPWIAPGLLDIQINGYGGTWFSQEQLSVDQVLQVLEAHYQYGITQLFPTLITNSQEALEEGFRVINTACQQAPWAEAIVAGCHLEGPYISKEDGPRGAHPLEHVRGCNWDEFARLQAASGNRIRLVTLAPEAEGAVDFIRQAVTQDVTISIGHTAANSAQITAAVDAGARLSTHLGNGAHGTLPRHPNYLWDQLGEPRLMASLIADGHHLPASVVRSFLFAKGPDNIILTCDASGLAGCHVGVHPYGDAEFEVLEDGRIVVAGQRQYLAGSGVQTDVCIAGMVRMTGCTLAQAWRMATVNPARLLGISHATLQIGQPADLVLFNFSAERLTIQQTVANGVIRHHR